MTRPAEILALAAALLFPPASVGATSIEVEHYWVSPTESAALAEFRKAFEARGGTWVDTPMANLDSLRSDLAERLAIGDPPGASQWYVGTNSREYVRLGAIVPIEVSADTSDWKGKIPPFIFDLISLDGSIYNIPVGIHVENWIWYNKSTFDRLGLSLPKTWPEIVETARRLKEAGETPFAFASDAWTQDLFLRALFTGVFADPADHALIQDWRAFLASPKLEEALELIDRLADVVDVPTEPRDWARANDDFIEGRAAMEIMGDWAKAEMMARGLVPGKDFVCEIPPGNEHYLSTVVDGFVFTQPETEETRAAQSMLAETLMDPAVQAAFSRIKGSSPVHTDAKLDALDVCAAKVTRALADPAVVSSQFIVDFPSYGGTRFGFETRRLLADRAATVAEALATLRAMAEDPQMN